MAKSTASHAIAKSTDTKRQSASHSPPTCLAPAAVTVVPLNHISIDDLTFQYRILPTWDDVKSALERDGQLEPVDLLAPKPYRIIDGFRRIHAASEIGWTNVTAFIYLDITEEQAHGIAFAKNVMRRNLSPLERANAIYQARQRGRTIEAIATDFGVSTKQIHRYEELLTFPKGLQGLVDDHDLSMAHATLLAACSIAEIVNWAEKVHEQSWSATDLRRELRMNRGKRAIPQIQQYLKLTGDLLKLSTIRIRKSATDADKTAVIAALRKAIEFLSA
jgi:ParB/RepB/Spo0J family partition protein